MLKRLVLVIVVFLCITMSVTPAIAVYSGITETIENVIQLKAIKSQSKAVLSYMDISSDTNAKKVIFTDCNALELRKTATESNVIVQAETTGTDSNADKK